MDQAVELREKANRLQGYQVSTLTQFGKSGMVIAVTSGKGGVGKTNVVANIAIALASMGHQVMVMDADLGLANLHVLLGLSPKYNLKHVILGEKAIPEIAVKAPGGFVLLPASSGVEELTALSPGERINLLTQFEQWTEPIDYLIIDTGAGINSNVMYFSSAAQIIIVVATPDPTSITDAYALMKVLSKNYGEKRFLLLANQVLSVTEGKRIHNQLSKVAERFLDISIDYLGQIPRDERVTTAIRRQQAVVQAFPNCPASNAFIQLAKDLTEISQKEMPIKGNIQFLWQRMIMPQTSSSL